MLVWNIIPAIMPADVFDPDGYTFEVVHKSWFRRMQSLASLSIDRDARALRGFPMLRVRLA